MHRYLLPLALLFSVPVVPVGAQDVESAPRPPAGTEVAAETDAVAARLSEGPLTLDALLEAVALRNPGLRARASAAEAAATRVDEASTLPDPMLQLGIMNVGLPELNADMAMSMAPSIQLSQRFPFPGKLGLAGDVAGSGAAMAVAGADEAWWEVRGRTADLFWSLWSLDRRVEVKRETLGLLQSFQTVARSLYASGSGRQADVLRADVEVARMDGEIRTLEARRRALVARINAVADRPSEAPLAAPVAPPLPAEVPDHATLAGWADESRPLLERARLAVRGADAGVELARKDIWPDVTLGLSYGQRDAGMGTERMGSAMVGFTLPVHASDRQFAARERARAQQRVADAELRGVRAEVDARIGEVLAELERARTLVALYADEVIPQARATVESALSSYRVGEVDFPTLVDAQRALDRYEEELHVLVADYGRALATLESTVGRTLPSTEAVLVTSSEAP